MINSNTFYFYCALHTTKSQSTTGESTKKDKNKQLQHLNNNDKKKSFFKRALSWRGAHGLSL